MSEEVKAWDAKRPCEYCGEMFAPKRPQDKDQHFCSSNHRKDFFRYGAKLRIVAALRKDFQRDIAALERRVAALENKYRKTIDTKPEMVVTLQQETEQK